MNQVLGSRPGGLQRSRAEEGRPPKKLSVRWADTSDGGYGALCQVLEFEVDRIRSTVASHRTLKEQLRKEKRIKFFH